MPPVLSTQQIPEEFRAHFERNFPARHTFGAPLACVDTYAGVFNISKSMRDSNLNCEPYDVLLSRRCDILTDDGKDMWAQLVVRGQPEGLGWVAPPCSSFVFHSSFLHRRTKADPAGNTTLKFVRRGNAIADSTSNMLRIFRARGMYGVLETPLSSKLPDYLSQTLADLGYVRVVVWLGKWGAPSKKGLQLSQ